MNTNRTASVISVRNGSLVGCGTVNIPKKHTITISTSKDDFNPEDGAVYAYETLVPYNRLHDLMEVQNKKFSQV